MSLSEELQNHNAWPRSAGGGTTFSEGSDAIFGDTIVKTMAGNFDLATFKTRRTIVRMQANRSRYIAANWAPQEMFKNG